MHARALVLEAPEHLTLQELDLRDPREGDVVVDVLWSGVSTGTERLLWTGRMPPFPGMGYPLVPGYESVGTVVEADGASGRTPGERVFVPGARCFEPVRGLFGASAERLVLPGSRAVPLRPDTGPEGCMMALAATARHAVGAGAGPPAELIVGHGALGRLMARITLALGHPAPTVWETDPRRRAGDFPYPVIDPADDDRADYGCIVDVSGSADLLDPLVGRLARGGEIVLGGFYDALTLTFPPAFMKEARFRIAAEFTPGDLGAVAGMVTGGTLDLGGLVTHRMPAADAERAYPRAFDDPECVKMVLDWSRETA